MVFVSQQSFAAHQGVVLQYSSFEIPHFISNFNMFVMPLRDRVAKFVDVCWVWGLK